MLKTYFDDLSRLIFRPILFYTRMPEGEVSDKPVTFLGMTAVILSLVATIVIFITQYNPIGATLLEKVLPAKIIIVVPALAMLAFMFFVITISILFSVFLAAFMGLFWLLGAMIFAGANMIKHKGEYLKDIKASFYLSGTTVVFIIPVIFIIFTKNKLMDFTNFMIGYNMLYSFWVLYAYGLLAIIARKVHGLPKTKAFIAALLPVLFLILVGLVIAKVVLPKIGPWVA